MVFYSLISANSFEFNIVAKPLNAKRMTIMAMGALLHWTQAKGFELVVRQSHGCPQVWILEGGCGDRFP